MRFFVFLGIICCGVAIITTWSQSTQPNERDERLESSIVALVGKVISRYPVVRKDKLVVSDPEKWKFPNPKDYLLASEFEIEVSTWIKADKKTPKQKTVRIIVPGYSPTHNDPILIIGKEYLVFLQKAKLDDKYQGAIVLRSKSGFISPENTFDPTDYFTVNFGSYGAISDEKKIKEYLQNLQKRP